jgi:predicted transposase/invertase (TIGR01784 family)
VTLNNKPRHDKLFRKALENPIVAYEFIEAHLPQSILSIIDTKTLKLEKESFIEPDLTGSISDVLFSCKLDNAGNSEDGYIYMLLEHQSTPDPLMAFRLFKYMVNICDRYLIENREAKHLPLIYPLVLYNGTKSYNVARNLWDLFNNTMLAKQFWTEDYQLVNVHDIPDAEFKKRTWSGIMEFFLKHIHERQLLKRWQEIADILPEITKVSIGYDYIQMILYYTLTAIDQSDKIELEKMLITTLNKEKGAELMTSLAMAWKEEGIEIGIQDGIKIGEKRGEARGKNNKAIEIAKNLLSQKVDINTVSTATGLSLNDIQKLI